MTEERPRQEQPRGSRQSRQGWRQAEARGQRGPQTTNRDAGLPASEYHTHLEREHNLRVVEEEGWPTEIKRYRLVRPAGDKGKKKDSVLTVFEGTMPQAVSHFYGYLHPQGDNVPVRTPSTQDVPAAGLPPSAEEDAA